MTQTLSDRYSPQDVEARTYSWWESSGYFKAQDVSTKPPFCIILPPPNVTGSLHMGHGVDHTIQDTLIRWKRMNGFNTLWLPGTDHAGIATQAVVEKELKKTGITRHQLGREEFVKKVWEWKTQYGGRIYDQMRRLGDSCDWDRSVFTLDEGVSKAVRKVFTTLYKKNLIYKGTRLVNWSPPLESAISDLEVEFKETKGTLWTLKYKVSNSEEFLEVATTRPETLLGDTAVCVNPKDPRYKKFIGQTVDLPLVGRKLKVIADDYVDMEFGSGVVKITPAHDFNDYKIGKTHNLEFLNILTTKGEINENGGVYKGLKVADARKKILEDLKTHGLLIKEEPHQLNVGHCSRTGAVVEPFLSDQWFVKMATLAEPAKRVVESETVQMDPNNWTKVYLHWMNNIEDWCVSRQLWWGHQIPAWNCSACGHITVSETDPTQCEKCKSAQITQDSDVLDTWFSSALWPFSALGWPKETEALKTFYPTNILVTGHDILFFWVARMMMAGLEFMRDVPFRTVFLHGLVRDSQGRKMSKSLGNSVDPVEMIEKYGADSLRYSILAHLHSGRDFKFSEQRIEGYRNFMNKIWNATRYSLTALNDFVPPEKTSLPEKAYLSIFDQWIISKLQELEKNTEEAFEAHRFSDVASEIYSFVWYEFCDWYLEFLKPIINGPPSVERTQSQMTLALVLNRILRLLHPLAPFISEELYQKLPIKSTACIIDRYPNVRNDKEFLQLGSSEALNEIDLIKQVIIAIRNIKGENKIKSDAPLKTRLIPSDGEVQKIIGRNKQTILTLARIENLDVNEDRNYSKCAVTTVAIKEMQVDVVIPLEGVVDLQEEIKRIQKLIEKNGKDVSILTGKLGDEKFRARASEDVIQADELLLKEAQVKLKTLSDSLARLQS